MDSSASLYASSIQNHHLCLLVKQLPVSNEPENHRNRLPDAGHGAQGKPRVNLGQTSSVSQAIRRAPSICPSDSDSHFLWLRPTDLAKTETPTLGSSPHPFPPSPGGGGGWGGTLGISGWGCAAGSLEPLTVYPKMSWLKCS